MFDVIQIRIEIAHLMKGPFNEKDNNINDLVL